MKKLFSLILLNGTGLKKLLQLKKLGGANTTKLFPLKMLDGTGIKKRPFNSIFQTGLAQKRSFH